MNSACTVISVPGSTLNINVDFIRQLDCINCIEMFGSGERALSPGASTRWGKRKIGGSREVDSGLDPPQDL